ncbi:hypothetical protein E2C01_055284 [Portunus trituberculatus]|uniref:Uncharacterized protein n=1 Tax=Portunus trituberculatus TaxID=210409 RepID=A0A5B7GUF0_PORTR|nr:hypothetical protein [Portunus trituberculatus]
MSSIKVVQVRGGIQTYARTSARSYAHHLIHYATASLSRILRNKTDRQFRDWLRWGVRDTICLLLGLRVSRSATPARHTPFCLCYARPQADRNAYRHHSCLLETTASIVITHTTATTIITTPTIATST